MVVLYIILLCILLFIIVQWVVKANELNKFDLSKVVGPKGYPIIGNLLEANVNRVELFYRCRKWRADYGGIYKIEILKLFYTIEISNPDDIELVLSTPIHNKKSYFYNFVRPWLQDGLLLSSGNKWHERRKILTPAFHFNILRHFTTLLEENSEIFVKILEAEVGKPKTDIIPLISGYTLNSICETAMGTKVNDDEATTAKYKKAVQEMGTILLERLTTFYYHSDFIFNFTKDGKKQRDTLKIIREFPNNIINKRREYIKHYGNNIIIKGTENKKEIHIKKNKKRMAMLDILLTAEEENKIDKKGIQEEVDTFMFEGHDTTAVALNFTLMNLANYKHVQYKVSQELKEVFGNSYRIATMDDLNQLKYLDCVIKETLRLYPSVHLIGRQLAENVKLSNYLIPAGVFCGIHIYDLHRRPDIYPNPLVFDPDRFLPQNSVGRHPYAYIPFSAGPRNCIGQKFAMLEMKSAVAAILRRLELHPITRPSDIIISGDIVLRTLDPIFIKFTLRK